MKVSLSPQTLSSHKFSRQSAKLSSTSNCGRPTRTSRSTFFNDFLKNGFLYLLPCILHLPPQHRAKDHLNVLNKRIIAVIIAIQPHLIGIDDILFLQVSTPLCPHFSCFICFRDFFPNLYFIFIRNERLVKFIKRASNSSSKSAQPGYIITTI